MAIRHWHGGKLAILWVTSVALALFGASMLEPYNTVQAFGAFGLAWLVLGAPWIVPITWKWLSGKERRGRAADE